MPISITATESKTFALSLRVKDSVLLVDKIIGGHTLKLSALFEKPGEVINNYFELRDAEGNGGKGYMNVALAFLPEGQSLDAETKKKLQELDYK